MNNKTYAIGCAILVTLLAGCNKDAEKPATTDAIPAATVPAATAPVEPAPGPPAKVDTVNPDDLKAGLLAMQPRVTKTVDGFTKVEPITTSRYSMPPTMEKDASIEFDTTGLSAVKLSPFMGDLNSSADCSANPEAGVVKFSWTLDDGQPTSITVDRNYTGLVDINIGNATRLRLDANNGNNAIICDWFSVGFLSVKAK